MIQNEIIKISYATMTSIILKISLFKQKKRINLKIKEDKD